MHDGALLSLTHSPGLLVQWWRVYEIMEGQISIDNIPAQVAAFGKGPVWRTAPVLSFRNITQSIVNFQASNAQDQGGSAISGMKPRLKLTQMIKDCGMFLEELGRCLAGEASLTCFIWLVSEMDVSTKGLSRPRSWSRYLVLEAILWAVTAKSQQIFQKLTID